MGILIKVGSPDQAFQPKQKRLFNFIKSLRRDSSGIVPLKERGKLHADPKDNADILNSQYESTWTREDMANIPTPDGSPYPSMDIRGLYKVPILFYPITLEGRRGTTDEFATIPFHLVLPSAALVEMAKSIPIHSLILSSHLFFCLPLFLCPFTVPCRIVFAKP